MRRGLVFLVLAGSAIACTLLRPLDDYAKEPPLSGEGGPGDADGGSDADAAPAPPSVVVSGLVEPGDLLVDATNVYFTTKGGGGALDSGAQGGGVFKCPKEGCVAQAIPLADKQAQPRGLSYDSNTIAWANESDGTVYTCATDTCLGALEVARNQTRPSSTLLQLQFTYYTTGGGTVARYTRGFGAGTILMATGQSEPTSMVGDARTLYWANQGSGDIVSQPTALGDGGVPQPPTVLARGEGRPSTLTTDGKSLYWGTGDAVRACEIPACAPRTLASGQAPVTVRVDASHAYWTSTTGEIMRCALAGCDDKPTVVVRGQAQPVGLGVDQTHVYWTSRGDGRVYRARKPAP